MKRTSRNIERKYIENKLKEVKQKYKKKGNCSIRKQGKVKSDTRKAIRTTNWQNYFTELLIKNAVEEGINHDLEDQIVLEGKDSKIPGITEIFAEIIKQEENNYIRRYMD